MLSKRVLLSLVALMFFSGSVSFANEKTAPKDWAFLTFLNGFNNLDQFGYDDINEMETVGSTSRVDVVVQWASLKTKTVRRVHVQKDNDPKNVTSPVIDNLGQIDMGDYRNLIAFVKWAAQKYPAKKYFLNVWNHGSGWHFTGEIPTSRDISYDDLSNNKITTEQLGLAVNELTKELGSKIEIVGADACLMAMAEVMGQMKDGMTTFIGSEEVEPVEGWPYDRLLTEWNAGGDKSALDVAKILTKSYLDSYPGDTRITLSGLDMSKYGQLASAVRDLGVEIKAQSLADRKQILQLASKSQSYTMSDYKDLGDFIDQLLKTSTLKIRPEVLAAVKTAISGFVTNNYTSADQKRSQGIAIWIPNSTYQLSSYRNRYRALAFNQDTDWLQAVESLFSASLSDSITTSMASSLK